MFYHFKLFFLLILMMGSLISISANSWMGMWIGLEINLLAFIPLIQMKNNSLSNESSLKYFLSQALASMILLMSIIFLSNNFILIKHIDNYMMIMFNSALLMKMGMAPFHFWFPEVIEGLNWINSFILLTWQKITPLVLIMYNLNYQYFFIIIILMSMLISTIMGINQSSFRKILAYSSINHMAWMISAMFFSETIWFYYLIIYFLMTFNIWFILYKLNVFYINQMVISIKNNLLLKIMFSFNFLSLGGLPPFIGFFPKWLTIQFMLSNWTLLALLMVIMTLFTLFYYMRLIYNILIINHYNLNYLINLKYNNFFLSFLNLFILFSLLLFSIFMFF
uniref:NADH-ubiquinone oxidoreductase chain 2 n=1 Tax=Staphylinidae sp. BMNH 1274640 TaxID=1796581 RepID=A0A140EFX9_9COLE|nr:NADH dehydrogenase subunit 2 [Staphylinidae sp. BMNH 1274640]